MNCKCQRVTFFYVKAFKSENSVKLRGQTNTVMVEENCLLAKSTEFIPRKTRKVSLDRES